LNNMERPIEKIQPNKIVFVKEAPSPSSTSAVETFENLMKGQHGFVTIRYFKMNAYVEFKETEDATETIRKFNGHKYHVDAPSLKLDYDRDAGKPKKRKLDSYATYDPIRMGYQYSPPRSYSSYYSDPRDYLRLEPQRIESIHPHHNDSYREGRSDSPGRGRYQRESSPPLQAPPRAYYDPYAWMRVFMPYWETTGNVPLDPLGRMEMNSHKLTKSCPTLFVKRLPMDITKRELQLMFCWLPNFLAARPIPKPNEVIAFIDFVDAASAYVAMACMQGFFIGGVSIQIEYDKWSGAQPHSTSIR